MSSSLIILLFTPAMGGFLFLGILLWLDRREDRLAGKR